MFLLHDLGALVKVSADFGNPWVNVIWPKISFINQSAQMKTAPELQMGLRQ